MSRLAVKEELTPTTLLAFHGKQSIKDKYLNRVRKHFENIPDETVEECLNWLERRSKDD
jgi:hypothetical protein